MFIDITYISHQVRSVIAINMILHTAFTIFMDWMLNCIQTTQEGRKEGHRNTRCDCTGCDRSIGDVWLRMIPIDVFVNNTNLTFQTFDTKLASCVSRHVLTVSDFQILIKSCSIESRNDPSPKSEVVHETKFSTTHACLVQSDMHQT